jgi:hypothetical protein
MDSLVIVPIPQQDLLDRTETDSKVLGDFGWLLMSVTSVVAQVDRLL